ncbi:MAG: ATP-binding protein [Nitrospinota bacterium]|nr:ATP-binding protein [Nitrospinota bacterium]
MRQEQASALNIEIRDPGARLRKGVAPALPFSQSPLTFMAGKAVAGNSGSSLAPYRDYRGIEVLGSWIWDDNLHIGMATEIDLNEALEPYHHARKRMVMVVGMIVFLALLFEAVLAFANRRYSRELEERSRILAQSQRISGAGSWVWTPVTGEMWLSVECYHLLELSPEEFTPSPEAFSSLFSGWSGEPLRELLDKLAASGGAMELETLYEGKDGAVRHFSIQGETRHPEDDPRHMVIGSVLDITERKEKEKALKLHQDHLEELLQQRAGDLVRMNQELKEFAYVASHDLKSPLRSAASLAGWLAEDYSDKLDKEGIDYIDQLLAQIDYMNKLIEGVLEYSSVDKSARRIAKLDSGKAASMVIDRMDKGDNTQITIEGQMPDVLYDDIQFTQTLQNLLDNAVKHMDKPDGKVAISCKDAGESWEFCVSDNGPGIEKEHYERIFRIFQRLKKGKSIDNTGIGLALVKKIVQSNGGKVWLESAPGEGSRFYFSVPKKPVSPHEYSQDNVI